MGGDCAEHNREGEGYPLEEADCEYLPLLPAVSEEDPMRLLSDADEVCGRADDDLRDVP